MSSLAAESSLSSPVYLRFSSVPVADIQSQLSLGSAEFVFAMFETMVQHDLTLFT